MTHPSFELALNKRRLYSWAHLPESSSPERALSGKAFSHRRYPILRLDHHGKRQLVWMRQGLIPAYAHDEDGAEGREEAHAERLTCCSCFRSAFRRRRCLIPADQLTELHHGPEREGGACSLALASGDIFSLAGVWETWENDNGHSVETFAVVTTPAAPDMQCIAARVPVVIAEVDQQRWLHAGALDDEPFELLKPLTPLQLRSWRLSPCL
jgi:putative SOS response-associated peptidase YedK